MMKLQKDQGVKELHMMAHMALVKLLKLPSKLCCIVMLVKPFACSVNYFEVELIRWTNSEFNSPGCEHYASSCHYVPFYALMPTMLMDLY